MIFGYLFITLLVVFTYKIVVFFANWLFPYFTVEGGTGETWDADHQSFVDETRPEDRMYWGEGFMGDTMGSISTSGDPF